MLFQSMKNLLINLRSIFAPSHTQVGLWAGESRVQQGAAQGGRLLVVRFPTAPVPDAKAPPLVGFVQPIAHATHWTPGKAGSQITFKIVVLSIFPALCRAYVIFTHPICVNM